MDQFGYAQVLNGGNDDLIVPQRDGQNPFARSAVSLVPLESEEGVLSLVLLQKASYLLFELLKVSLFQDWMDMERIDDLPFHKLGDLSDGTGKCFLPFGNEEFPAFTRLEACHRFLRASISTI
mgnify:CR=1 FL=1